jgi:hypothetical protein
VSNSTDPEAPQVEDQPFKAVAEALCRFDTTDLLAAVSGLQLMPQNADRYVRLEALANITAATASQPNKPRVNSEALALISNSWLIEFSTDSNRSKKLFCLTIMRRTNCFCC